MRRLVDVLGHPEQASPALHVTGTNGKTSTARCLTALLTAKGLRTGTFTSPHLERINERLAADGEPISDADLAEVLTDLAGLEPLLGPGVRFTWFEILTGAALRWFADRPVDVAVSRWDSVAAGTPPMSWTPAWRWSPTSASTTSSSSDRPERTSQARRPASSSRVRPWCSASRTPTCAHLRARRPAELWWPDGTMDAAVTSWRSVAGSLDCGRPRPPTRTSGWTCTAATRATTLPPPWPPPRPSSAHPSTTDSSAMRPRRCVRRDGSRSSVATRW